MLHEDVLALSFKFSLDKSFVMSFRNDAKSQHDTTSKPIMGVAVVTVKNVATPCTSKINRYPDDVLQSKGNLQTENEVIYCKEIEIDFL